MEQPLLRGPDAEVEQPLLRVPDVDEKGHEPHPLDHAVIAYHHDKPIIDTQLAILPPDGKWSHEEWLGLGFGLGTLVLALGIAFILWKVS